MSTIFSSNDNGRRGKIESVFSVEYHEQKNHNGLVLFVGLVLVVAIVLFILRHWDASLLLSLGVFTPDPFLDENNEWKQDKKFAFVIAALVLFVGLPLAIVLA